MESVQPVVQPRDCSTEYAQRFENAFFRERLCNGNDTRFIEYPLGNALIFYPHGSHPKKQQLKNRTPVARSFSRAYSRATGAPASAAPSDQRRRTISPTARSKRRRLSSFFKGSSDGSISRVPVKMQPSRRLDAPQEEEDETLIGNLVVHVAGSQAVPNQEPKYICELRSKTRDGKGPQNANRMQKLELPLNNRLFTGMSKRKAATLSLDGHTLYPGSATNSMVVGSARKTVQPLNISFGDGNGFESFREGCFPPATFSPGAPELVSPAAPLSLVGTKTTPMRRVSQQGVRGQTGGAKREQEREHNKKTARESFKKLLQQTNVMVQIPGQPTVPDSISKRGKASPFTTKTYGVAGDSLQDPSVVNTENAVSEEDAFDLSLRNMFVYGKGESKTEFIKGSAAKRSRCEESGESRLAHSEEHHERSPELSEKGALRASQRKEGAAAGRAAEDEVVLEKPAEEEGETMHTTTAGGGPSKAEASAMVDHGAPLPAVTVPLMQKVQIKR